MIDKEKTKRLCNEGVCKSFAEARRLQMQVPREKLEGLIKEKKRKIKEPACPSMKPRSRTCRIDGQKCDTETAYECPKEGEE